MTAKKKSPKRRRPPPPQPKMVEACAEVAAPPPAAVPNFGLIYTHLSGGKIVMGVHGPSFTTFRNKSDAAEWLRGLARSIETSWPTE